MKTTTQKDTYKVLLVDDDPFFLNLYSKKAKRYNIDLHAADSAENALEKIQSGFIPDVFVVDLDMPVLNGFELIAKIKEGNLAPHAKFTILTNKNEPYYIEKAKPYSIDLYIIKAMYVPSEVIDAVFNLLDSDKK